MWATRTLSTALQPGESDRAKLTGPRWQASFDLAMGQILAARCRIEGYNSTLAQLKQGKTEITYGFTETMLKAGQEEYQKVFARINPVES